MRRRQHRMDTRARRRRKEWEYDEITRILTRSVITSVVKRLEDQVTAARTDADPVALVRPFIEARDTLDFFCQGDTYEATQLRPYLRTVTETLETMREMLARALLEREHLQAHPALTLTTEDVCIR